MDRSLVIAYPIQPQAITIPFLSQRRLVSVIQAYIFVTRTSNWTQFFHFYFRRCVCVLWDCRRCSRVAPTMVATIPIVLHWMLGFFSTCSGSVMRCACIFVRLDGSPWMNQIGRQWESQYRGWERGGGIEETPVMMKLQKNVYSERCWRMGDLIWHQVSTVQFG